MESMPVSKCCVVRYLRDDFTDIRPSNFKMGIQSAPDFFAFPLFANAYHNGKIWMHLQVLSCPSLIKRGDGELRKVFEAQCTSETLCTTMNAGPARDEVIDALQWYFSIPDCRISLENFLFCFRSLCEVQDCTVLCRRIFSLYWMCIVAICTTHVSTAFGSISLCLKFLLGFCDFVTVRWLFKFDICNTENRMRSLFATRSQVNLNILVCIWMFLKQETKPVVSLDFLELSSCNIALVFKHFGSKDPSWLRTVCYIMPFPFRVFCFNRTQPQFRTHSNA